MSKDPYSYQAIDMLMETDCGRIITLRRDNSSGQWSVRSKFSEDDNLALDLEYEKKRKLNEAN